MICDLLSSEYGWTTEYTLGRTMREISWRVSAINSRLNKRYLATAQLHGLYSPVDTGPKIEATAKLTPDERANIEKHKQMALNRIKERAKQRG